MMNEAELADIKTTRTNLELMGALLLESNGAHPEDGLLIRSLAMDKVVATVMTDSPEMDLWVANTIISAAEGFLALCTEQGL